LYKPQIEGGKNGAIEQFSKKYINQSYPVNEEEKEKTLR
jgi:hypothetical protein